MVPAWPVSPLFSMYSLLFPFAMNTSTPSAPVSTKKQSSRSNVEGDRSAVVYSNLPPPATSTMRADKRLVRHCPLPCVAPPATTAAEGDSPSSCPRHCATATFSCRRESRVKDPSNVRGRGTPCLAVSFGGWCAVPLLRATRGCRSEQQSADLLVPCLPGIDGGKHVFSTTTPRPAYRAECSCRIRALSAGCALQASECCFPSMQLALLHSTAHQLLVLMLMRAQMTGWW